MRLRHIILLLLSAATLTSCDAIKHFASQDLAEEDFIIGKLYEDEMVKEQLYTPTTPQGQPTKGTAFDQAKTNGTNKKLYDAVQPWMGTPYKYGGTTRQGVDCSAFVGNIYKDAYGITLHRTANDIQQDVNKVARANLREGDIIFFVNSHQKVSHVGIYLHDGMFVHASTSNGVSISSLTNNYWNTHYHHAGRHPRLK